MRQIIRMCKQIGFKIPIGRSVASKKTRIGIIRELNLDCELWKERGTYKNNNEIERKKQIREG